MSLMTFVKEMKVTSFSNFQPSKAFLPLGKAQQ